VRLNQPPLRCVTVDADVHWTQAARGSIDGVRGGTLLTTYTGDGLIQDWPKAGATIGGGWEVGFGSAVDIDGVGKRADDAFKNADPGGPADRVDNGRLVPAATPPGWL